MTHEEETLVLQLSGFIIGRYTNNNPPTSLDEATQMLNDLGINISIGDTFEGVRLKLHVFLANKNSPASPSSPNDAYDRAMAIL